ncbi:hypothetical protein EYZ11_004609 [Aspergillus tanneri]|uniref:Uncharacterized protein n=1 Tax=Aspergillus tanneri TaxID=1220188 RepID=A0A4S3JKD2_9EURO|nr:hypothetical protein EYZ11_004609 [Aspergillus tanneri]
MAEPATDAPAVEEFAQTRGGDDLFDDEIIPVSAEVHAQPEVQVTEETVAPVDSDPQPARVDTPSRVRGGDRRGRGRGRGRGRRGSQNSSQRRSDGAQRPKSADTAPQLENKGLESSIHNPANDNADQSNHDDHATSDTKPSVGADAPKVPAVRGDRSATGGLKKPKLTEEELSRRIAAAKENAAKKAAAHARAEADQASFLEREKVAEVKRQQERQNRRVMDSERERNRQRKLQALNGREWDMQKQDDMDSPRGARGRFRGMHGGVSGYARRDFGGLPADDEMADNAPHYDSNNHYRGRGRSGRGGRGRGNGRGPRAGDPTVGGASDHSATTEQKPAPTPPVINDEADFPALPISEKKNSPSGVTEAANIESSISPLSATGASWAEQVESSRE